MDSRFEGWSITVSGPKEDAEAGKGEKSKLQRSQLAVQRCHSLGSAVSAKLPRTCGDKANSLPLFPGSFNSWFLLNFFMQRPLCIVGKDGVRLHAPSGNLTEIFRMIDMPVQVTNWIYSQEPYKFALLDKEKCNILFICNDLGNM